MNDAQVLMVGGLVSAIGGMLFLATWFVMAMFPSKVLLGGVEGLWLRCLIRVVYVGLFVIVLGVVNVIIKTSTLRK